MYLTKILLENEKCNKHKRKIDKNRQDRNLSFFFN